MNPRAEHPDIGPKARVVRSQIVRRSMIFDEDGALRQRLGSRRGQWPQHGAGMLFLAYMGNIESQFERLHNDWGLDTLFPPPNSKLRDPLLFGSSEPWQWRGIEFPPVPAFIKRRGGEYFYVPSLCWLRRGGTA